MKAEQRRRKGSHEHDLAKSRNANKQQREDEEATTRKVGMLHSELRGSNSIARESKQRNMTRTPTCTKLKKHKNMPPKIELVQEMINRHSNIAQHVQEKAMRMAHAISDMEMERSSICPVKGEQQDASEECCDAEPRLLGETSTAENQTGDAQGREDHSKPRQRRMRMSGIKQPTNINHRILNICS